MSYPQDMGKNNNLSPSLYTPGGKLWFSSPSNSQFNQKIRQFFGPTNLGFSLSLGPVRGYLGNSFEPIFKLRGSLLG